MFRFYTMICSQEGKHSLNNIDYIFIKNFGLWFWALILEERECNF